MAPEGYDAQDYLEVVARSLEAAGEDWKSEAMDILRATVHNMQRVYPGEYSPATTAVKAIVEHLISQGFTKEQVFSEVAGLIVVEIPGRELSAVRAELCVFLAEHDMTDKVSELSRNSEFILESHQPHVLLALAESYARQGQEELAVRAIEGASAIKGTFGETDIKRIDSIFQVLKDLSVPN